MEFEAVFNACTQNREQLVLSNTFNESDEISDNAFWWKAKVYKKFRVNKHSVAWRLSKQLYDKDHLLRDPMAKKTAVAPKNMRVINFKQGLPNALKKAKL